MSFVWPWVKQHCLNNIYFLQLLCDSLPTHVTVVYPAVFEPLPLLFLITKHSFDF